MELYYIQMLFLDECSRIAQNMFGEPCKVTSKRRMHFSLDLQSSPDIQDKVFENAVKINDQERTREKVK